MPPGRNGQGAFIFMPPLPAHLPAGTKMFVLFLDAQVWECPGPRLVDFLEPEAFARRMDQLLNTDSREE